MRLLVCISVLALASSSFAYSPDDFIHTLGATMWGFWGQTMACPEGSYANAFELKVEKQHILIDDDTSVNAIKLYCHDPNTGQETGEVTSATMDRGSWKGKHQCASGYLNGYDIKSQRDQGGIGDDTAANALRMYCIDDGGDKYLESPGNKWGNWLGPSFCRSDMAVCGLMTRVQDNQGTLGDDTALNDVRFLCCKLPS